MQVKNSENMSIDEVMYCFKAESERYPETCEECPLYKKTGYEHCYKDATDIAIQALEELQQYREIGSIKDFKEFREKQIGIKMAVGNDNGNQRKCCGNCGCFVLPASTYCSKCGWKIDRD